jgi:hypothetical protein
LMLAAYLKAAQPGDTTPATATFTAGYKDTAGGTTITFTAADFGAEATGRRIYVAVLARASVLRTVSSVTIGGVSATLMAGNASSAGPIAIYAANVPTGTSGNVVVTFSGSVTTTVISVYRVVDQTTPLASATLQTDTAVNLSVTSTSRTVNTSAFGFVLVEVNLAAARSLTTTNWTIDYETGTTQLQAGLGTSSGATTTYSASWTSSTNIGMLAASFKK